MKVRPLYNNILITPIDDKVTSGGFYVPEDVKDQQFKARVVAIGEGKYDYETKEFLPHAVKVGDLILHKRWGISTLKIENKEHFVISEDDVLGIIEE